MHGTNSMKLLFLGTSAGWPLPRMGCDCKICTSKDPRDKRLRPSLLVNEKYLIDASPDIYHELKNHNIDPTKITHIFLTHAHDDHIMGLYDLTHIYNNKKKIMLMSTQGVLAETRKKMGISMLSFKTKKVRPMEKVKLENDVQIWFVPVRHTVETYAVKIKAPRPIAYAPEFRSIRPSSKKQLGDIEVAIIDGSSKTRKGQAKGHETIEEGLRLGKEIGAKKVYFTNLGHKTDTHEDLVRFVKKEGGNKFNIPYDGLEIEV